MSYHSFGKLSVGRLPQWNWARILRWDFSWLAPTWWHTVGSPSADILHIHVDPNLLLLVRTRRRILHLRTPAPQFYAPSYRRLLKHADAVVANSNFIRDQFLRASDYPPSRVFTVYNGVDVSLFNHVEATNPRKRLGLEKDAIALLYVGAIVPEKGVSFLVKGMAELSHRLPKIILIVVGGASVWLRGQEYEQEVRELSQGLQVKFLGPVPHAEMPDIYSACDMLVMPSIWSEPFGLVLLEAMASGKPVIATRVGGIPEIVLHGETGFLVPPKDVSSLASTISDLVVKPDLLKKMGRAARLHAQEFTWDRTVRGFDKVYDTILRS